MRKFWSATKSFWANYGDFRGRTSRADYWLAVLFLTLSGLIVALIDVFALPYIGLGLVVFGGLGILSTVYGFVTAIPGLAMVWRRMSDMGQPGWWAVLPLALVGASFLPIPDLLQVSWNTLFGTFFLALAGVTLVVLLFFSFQPSRYGKRSPRNAMLVSIAMATAFVFVVATLDGNGLRIPSLLGAGSGESIWSEQGEFEATPGSADWGDRISNGYRCQGDPIAFQRSVIEVAVFTPLDSRGNDSFDVRSDPRTANSLGGDNQRIFDSEVFVIGIMDTNNSSLPGHDIDYSSNEWWQLQGSDLYLYDLEESAFYPKPPEVCVRFLFPDQAATTYLWAFIPRGLETVTLTGPKGFRDTYLVSEIRDKAPSIPNLLTVDGADQKGLARIGDTVSNGGVSISASGMDCPGGPEDEGQRCWWSASQETLPGYSDNNTDFARIDLVIENSTNTDIWISPYLYLDQGGWGGAVFETSDDGGLVPAGETRRKYLMINTLITQAELIFYYGEFWKPREYVGTFFLTADDPTPRPSR